MAKRKSAAKVVPIITHNESGSNQGDVIGASKIETIVKLLKRPGGVQVDEIMREVGWQAHSVRGALSGTIKKKLGLPLLSEKIDGKRIYRVTSESGQ